MSEYIELKPVMDFIDINIKLAKKQVVENKTSSDFWQGYYTAKKETYRAMKAFLETEPKGDVAPVRHGRWMDAESDDGCTVWHCSVCSYPVKTIGGYPIYKYCPMCGARMGKGDEHEAD